MLTPSSSISGSVSRLVPCGQMTCTSHPASRRVVLSCQTRRSNGTDRFSTRMSALPAKTVVPRIRPTHFRVGEADKVNDRTVAGRVEHGEHRWVFAADNEHFGVCEDVVDGVGEQVAEVRQPALDKLP